MPVPITHGRARVADQARDARPADPRGEFDRQFNWPIPKPPMTAGQDRPLVGSNLVRAMNPRSPAHDPMLGGL